MSLLIKDRLPLIKDNMLFLTQENGKSDQGEHFLIDRVAYLLGQREDYSHGQKKKHIRFGPKGNNILMTPGSQRFAINSLIPGVPWEAPRCKTGEIATGSKNPQVYPTKGKWDRPMDPYCEYMYV